MSLNPESLLSRLQSLRIITSSFVEIDFKIFEIRTKDILSVYCHSGLLPSFLFLKSTLPLFKFGVLDLKFRIYYQRF